MYGITVLALGALLAQETRAGASEADVVLQAMAVELRPKVESVAGRRMDRMPVVRSIPRFVWEAIAQKSLESDYRTLNGINEREARESAAWTVRTQSPNAVALYWNPNHEIVVFPEKYKGLAKRLGATPDLIVPVISCLLAHELVHAVQAAQPQFKAHSEDEIRALSVLVEGQAEEIGRRVCENGEERTFDPRIRALQRAMWFGLGNLSAHPSETYLGYVYGRIWMAALVDERGMEATWEVLSSPPPDPVSVVEAVRRRTAPPEDLAAALTAGVHALVGERNWRSDFDPALVLSDFAQLPFQSSVPNIPEAIAGHVAAITPVPAYRSKARLAIGAFRMADPESAGAAVRVFRDHANAYRQDRVHSNYVWTGHVRPLRRARRMLGADAVGVDLGQAGEGFFWRWAAVGDLVLTIGAIDFKPSSRRVADAFGALNEHLRGAASEG